MGFTVQGTATDKQGAGSEPEVGKGSRVQGQSPGDCDKQVAGEVAHLPAKSLPAMAEDFQTGKGLLTKGWKSRKCGHSAALRGGNLAPH